MRSDLRYLSGSKVDIYVFNVRVSNSLWPEDRYREVEKNFGVLKSGEAMLRHLSRSSEGRHLPIDLSLFEEALARKKFVLNSWKPGGILRYSSRDRDNTCWLTVNIGKMLKAGKQSWWKVRLF